MRTLLNNPNFALESIDFQSTAFLKELTATFEELRKVPAKEMGDSAEAAQLSRVIAHHTGMNIGFSIADVMPCVEIPMLDRNNVLINSMIRNFVNSSDGLRMIAAAEDGVVRGKVNIRTGRVSGIFTEVKSTIHLPTSMLTNTSKYSAEEIAAITLHEVGHLFTYFEYITRSVATNQALAGMSKALDGSNSPAEREAIFIGVKKALKLTDLDAKELAKSNNTRVAEVVVIASVARQTVHELDSNIYDFSTWEYLADQYAARHGAGRHIVTALEKLYRGTFNISFRSLPAYLAMEAVKVGLFLAAATPIGPLAVKISLLMMLLDGQGDGTYDLPGARFKRVRNQIVEALKAPKLPPEEVKRYQDDLVAIDKVLEGVEDRRQLIGVLWDAVNPRMWKANAQEKMQQELEAIAANDLFVRAADFKQLAA
jgi:hypothetical protein